MSLPSQSSDMSTPALDLVTWLADFKRTMNDLNAEFAELFDTPEDDDATVQPVAPSAGSSSASATIDSSVPAQPPSQEARAIWDMIDQVYDYTFGNPCYPWRGLGISREDALKFKSHFHACYSLRKEKRLQERNEWKMSPSQVYFERCRLRRYATVFAKRMTK
jgi:hypothetical protein